MARRSTVYSLPEKTRESLYAKWRSGQFSVDQLTRLAGGKVSRSALFRYLFTADDYYKEHRMLQEAAGVWCPPPGEDPGGDVGRLCQEMLRVLAHAKIRSLHDQPAASIGINDVVRLARALKDLETASSLSAARAIKLRELIVTRLDTEIGSARSRGIDPAALERAKLIVRGGLNAAGDQPSGIDTQPGVCQPNLDNRRSG